MGLRGRRKRFDRPGARGRGVGTTTRCMRDLGIAVGAGVGMAVLAFGVMTRSPPELLAQHFLERAYTEGGGTNVVNVILVDFRGFDTLGRSEEHTSELQSLMRISYAVFCLKKKNKIATRMN